MIIGASRQVVRLEQIPNPLDFGVVTTLSPLLPLAVAENQMRDTRLRHKCTLGPSFRKAVAVEYDS